MLDWRTEKTTLQIIRVYVVVELVYKIDSEVSGSQGNGRM